jgi:iron(III) transport system substrate-binding protein
MRFETSPIRRARRQPILVLAFVALLAALAWGCAAGSTSGPTTGPTAPIVGSPTADPAAADPVAGTITVYTSVTQATVDAVVDGFKAANPGVTVSVFRAPTGQLAARIAADLRDGRIHTDVLWLTDPLSIQAYAAQGLLQAWEPANATGIPAADRSTDYWGTRFLNMAMVRGASVSPGPAAWRDLADPAYRDAIGIPDPAVAGSAFGTLAWFDQAPGGLDFYRALKDDGAVQVPTPDDVVTGVAQGRFKVGMTLDSSARAAIAKGSPIELVWPTDGAISMYSPIGVVGAALNPSAAKALVEYVLSAPGQASIAATGWQPMRPDAGGPAAGGPQVSPDWTAAFGRQKDLLDEYRAIFGG